MQNNRNLKLIVGAIGLRRGDVARAVTIGGIETSNSLADGWLRSADSTKRGTGSSGAAVLSRSRVMTDEQFAAFCVGLKLVLDEIEAEQ